ncbi:MAG: ATP-binding protein [Candidatus Pacebacteria bacterium]|nr:ATP-binding protein [Candidatus Paceibacterota bacterium]
MNQHIILKKYITGLVKGLSDNLLVVGRAGTGKTELMLRTLKEMNLNEKEHYLYIPNYITPRALVDKLEEVNKLKSPRVFVIDDGEDTLRNIQSVGVLKGAMWRAGGRKRVSWLTSRGKKEFDFMGKIIFLLNKFDKKNALLNSLKDRSLYFEISLSPQDIKTLIVERAKEPYHTTSYEQRIKVANFLVQQSNPNISLRAFPHALNLMLLSPHHWKVLTQEIIKNK